MSATLVVCETCKSEVRAEPYCARCGAVLLGAAAVFTEAATVSTYSEAAPEKEPVQDELLARLGLMETTPTDVEEPAETAAEQHVPESDSAPVPVEEESATPEDVAVAGSTSGGGDELDAALARNASDLTAPIDTPALAETPTRRGWLALILRWWWVGAIGAFLVLLLGGIVLVSISSASHSSQKAPRPSSTTAAASSQKGPLPGYASKQVWGAAAKRAVVTADGGRVLVVYPTASGTTAAVRGMKDGKSISTSDVAADAAPMVAGNTLLVRSGDKVLAWASGATEPTAVPAPEGSTLLVRAGTGFLVDGGAATVFTDGGLVSVTAPRAGMVPLGYLSETQTIVWASATGHLVTGAVTGSVVHDVALVAPAADATVSGWLAATDKFAFLTWTTPAGTVLAVHSLENGSVTAQAPISGAPLVSPSGTMLAAAGALVTTGSGELVAETEFVPAAFLSDKDLYGTTKAGRPALWHAGKVSDATAGVWQPVALSSKGLLAADPSGIALFPPTKK
ncbi:hypothetical protein ACIPY5_19895 [Microbacterium sp. NPDC089698]|uniref:hypothetical protein n=1 Tax=Microbacterium sp. NPDC089698 TaxID=3364200 RepID=UPI00381E65FE